MKRVSSTPVSLALHGVAGSRAVERLALASLPPHGLVKRAGESVGRLALALAPDARHVWIACGPGNNGADGLIAAVWLLAAGKNVSIDISGAVEPSRQSAETIEAMRHVTAAGVRITSEVPVLGPSDMAIDALLGLGANRAPEGRIAELVGTINDRHCHVLAVDLPSGLNADTGQPAGDLCARATHTLSLLTLHPGLYTGRGRDHAGDIWFDNLEIDASSLSNDGPDAWLSSEADALALEKMPGHSQNKGSFGDVAVIGGGIGMTGAPLMAARAAHAGGAGRVYVSLLDPAAPTLDIVRPELMFRHAWWNGDDKQLSAATVVCGCGGSDAIVLALPTLLRRAGRLVLDADALNHIAADSGLQTLLRSRADRRLPTVLTPHPLEAARLLSSDTTSVQHDRAAAAGALAERYRCVALVKGSGTLVAAPGRAPFINRSGNGSLATAGTGDVLAGWLGGLWSRAASAAAIGKDASIEEHLDVAMKAAVAAVYLHGKAGENSGLATTRAADLVEQLLKDRSA